MRTIKLRYYEGKIPKFLNVKDGCVTIYPTNSIGASPNHTYYCIILPCDSTAQIFDEDALRHFIFTNREHNPQLSF